MQVILERPTRRDRSEFLALVRASRALHRLWVHPPSTPADFGRYLARSRRPDHDASLVRTRAGRELVGVVNLGHLVRGNLQGAFLGFYAFAPCAGRGLMARGLALALARGFGELGLHRVEANVQPGNERSRRLVARLGFVREGFSERYLKVGGRWRDHERWALRAEQWREGRARGR